MRTVRLLASTTVWLCGAVALAPLRAEGQPVSLVHAHAHNDYEHARPLFEALERGFNSIEADVYLVSGQLLVGHSRDSLSTSRTLESLYLDPLRAHIQRNGGHAVTGAEPLILLIDVKSEAESAYVALNAVLRRYADLFVIFTPGAVIDGPVLAVISGNRASATMRRARVRFASIDGRLPDLGGSSAAPARMMPLISDSWEKVTKWNGDGPAPPSLQRDIARIAGRAHTKGQRLRFWATPDKPAVWQLLLDAGVDLIGADDLEGLREFLARGQPSGTGLRLGSG